MNKKSVLSIGLRVIGLLALITGLGHLIDLVLPAYGFLPVPRQPDSVTYPGLRGAALLLNLIIAFIFLRFADTITGRKTPANEEPQEHDSSLFESKALTLAFLTSQALRRYKARGLKQYRDTAMASQRSRCVKTVWPFRANKNKI
jgi:hypothetical protein